MKIRKKAPPQPVPQQPESLIVGTEKEETPKPHWLIKNIVFPLKCFFAEINPVHWVTIILLLITAYTACVFVVTPMLKEQPITEFRLLVVVGAALFGWLAACVYHNNIGANVCQLNLNDKHIFVNNSTVEKLEHSERVHVVNRFGMPIYNNLNNTENPLRLNKQITISIPNELLMEFGSCEGMSNLHYSGATLTEIQNMTDIDFSLFYQPKRVSEERLRKDNEFLNLKIEVSEKIVTKLERDLISMTKTIRGPAQNSINHLIKNMSELRNTFMTDSHLHQLITNENIGGPFWRNRYSPYSFGYNNYGNEYSSQPNWARFGNSNRQSQQQETDDEEPVE